MPIISIPAAVRFRNLKWTAPPSYRFNRSELTGRSRAIQLGPAERWTATGELVTTNGTNAVAVRGFLANMKVPTNLCRLRMVEFPQVTIGGRATSATVNGAGQLGMTLALSGMTPSVTNLVAGNIISIVLGTEASQPIVLGADLVANGSGQATAVLTTPLRQSPANGAVVEMQWPTATVRMRDPLQWEANPGGLYDSPFVAEEAF